MLPILRTWSDLLTAKRWHDVNQFLSEVVYSNGTLHEYLTKTNHLERLYRITGNQTDYFLAPSASSVNCVSFSKPGEFLYSITNYCSNQSSLSMTIVLGGTIFENWDRDNNIYIVDPDWDVSVPSLVVLTNGKTVKLCYYNPPVQGFGEYADTFCSVSNYLDTSDS
jgi:hypothetical protein